MKSYREIADSVFARREQYVIAQRKKKQLVTRVTASVGSVALVSLAGIALLRSDAFRETPPLSDGGATTTTTHIPTEGEATTTTTTTVNATAPAPTTDGGVVTPPTTVPTTTAPAPSKPTATQAPTTGKTEPSKTTTTTTAVKDKLLITGDELDNYFDGVSGDILDAGAVGGGYGYESRISPTLQKKMKQYRYYTDAVYAVIVEIPFTNKDKESFWQSTEELKQFCKEYHDVFDAFQEEAKRLNPSWSNGNTQDIEVWTDTMRANYEYWLTLDDEMNRLKKMDKTSYYQSVLEQRFEALKAFCGEEPILFSFKQVPNQRFWYYGYYLELTAQQINTLAEQGGYTFCLTLPIDVLLELWGWEDEFM